MGVDENRQATQAAYDGFVKGDMEPLMSLLADDVEWTAHLRSEDPISGTFRGPEGVKEYFGAMQANLEIRNFEVAQLIAEGDFVVALIKLSNKNNATGEEFEGKAVHILRFNEQGKLAVWELFRAF